MNALSTLSVLTLASFLAFACGRDEEGKAPPTKEGASKETHSLENGTYYIEDVRELQDGCGRNPMDSSDPITGVAFQLTNTNKGQITIDRCIYEGKSVQGFVQDNSGVLTTLHSLRREGNGSAVAEYQQECRMEIITKADNQFEAKFIEYQRNRNQVMRKLTVDAAECVTSYSFTMKKKK
jgi:hypothetical protein